MSYSRGKIKFPCGYEFEVECKGFLVEMEFKDDDLCPLHGKDCLKALKGVKK